MFVFGLFVNFFSLCVISLFVFILFIFSLFVFRSCSCLQSVCVQCSCASKSLFVLQTVQLYPPVFLANCTGRSVFICSNIPLYYKLILSYSCLCPSVFCLYVCLLSILSNYMSISSVQCSVWLEPRERERNITREFQNHILVDRQIDRQIDRYIDRQIDRQIDR